MSYSAVNVFPLTSTIVHVMYSVMYSMYDCVCFLFCGCLEDKQWRVVVICHVNLLIRSPARYHCAKTKPLFLIRG